MRILAIRGRNLASLARAFEVDLVDGPLGGVGLFAITGPVGAGKSTLLDALCLALFDRTPRLSGRGGVFVGDDGEARGDWLRSTDPRSLLRRDAAEGHAEVDFTGRDGVRYRARWVVRRARRRPDGRVQDQEMSLVDLDRETLVAGGRKTEVLAAIEQRLGLDFGQFCRSVLLAQGEFAAFLRASADERARLLENLTGADIYRKLSRAAHERRRQGEVHVQVLRAQLEAQAPLEPSARAALELAARQVAGEQAVCEVGIDLASRYVTWHAAAARHRQHESEATVALQQAVDVDAMACTRRQRLMRWQRALPVVVRWEVAEQQRDAAKRARDVVAAVVAERTRCASEQQAAAAAMTAELRSAFGSSIGSSIGSTAGSTAGSAADSMVDSAAGSVMGPTVGWTIGAMPTVPAIVRDLPQWAPLLQQWQDAEVRAAKLTSGLPRLLAEVDATAGRLATTKAALATTHASQQQAALAAEAARQAAQAPALAAVASLRVEVRERRDKVVVWQQLAERWQRSASEAGRIDERLAGLVAEHAHLVKLTAEAELQRDAASRRVVELRRAETLMRTHQSLATLRAQLVAGEACPLCGATEHAEVPAVTEPDLLAAQQAVLAAEQAREAAHGRAAASLGECRRVERDRLATSQAATTARREGEDARLAWRQQVAAEAELLACTEPDAAMRAVDARQAAVVEAEGTLQGLEESAAQAAKAYHLALERLAAAELAHREARELVRLHEQQHRDATVRAEASQLDGERLLEAIASLQGVLVAACEGLPGGADAVLGLGKERLRRLQGMHRLHVTMTTAATAAARFSERLALAEAAARQADADETKARQALARAMAVAEVDDADVEAAARAGIDALAAEGQALQALADEVTSRRAVLQERAKQRRAHEDHDRPELEAADAALALEQARRARDEAERRRVDLSSQLQADDAIRRQRAEVEPRLLDAERQLDVWRMLDDLIGSSGGDAFVVFAQSLTLDLLLSEANRRLAELARRYRLQKNPGGEMDFVVVDLDLGGTRRGLQSLSGGETFLVSLALALALATLAAPRSRVETLFLDEGFGTLDAQNLEAALGALDNLQAMGCQVGVISHVDGVAERIGAVVEVRPEGGGQSRVRVRTA